MSITEQEVTERRRQRRTIALAGGASFYFAQTLWMMIKIFVIDGFMPVSGTRFEYAKTIATIMVVPSVFCGVGVLFAAHRLPRMVSGHQDRLKWAGTAAGLLSGIPWLGCWLLLDLAGSKRLIFIEGLVLSILLVPIAALAMAVIVRVMELRLWLVVSVKGRCSTCGYDLRGLDYTDATVICPECGDRVRNI